MKSVARRLPRVPGQRPGETISASTFKAKCLGLMDQVARDGRPLTITKNGKPVARLVPVVERSASLFGRNFGNVAILGDIIEPIDVPWEAVRRKSAAR